MRLYKLSKAYDKNTALKEVSLKMMPGQLFALLGQNGAGKTVRLANLYAPARHVPAGVCTVITCSSCAQTLVNCISGLVSPTHGEAFMFGSSVRADVAQLRDRMGTCPQHVRDSACAMTASRVETQLPW